MSKYAAQNNVSSELSSELSRLERVKAGELFIIVTGKLEKPYYEVLYYDLADNNWHIGYSSYDLDIVAGDIQRYFEVDKDFSKEDAKRALEKQIPKKIQLDNDNGVYEKEYCPLCNKRLFSGEKYCSRCGQALDWSDEK